MTTESQSEDHEEQIESTLVFDTDERYAEDPTLELIAEGIHERGSRSVRIEYVRYENEWGDLSLWENHYYRLDGERKNERENITWILSESEDGYIVDENGQELHEFIEANFMIDPGVELGEAFENMVDLE